MFSRASGVRSVVLPPPFTEKVRTEFQSVVLLPKISVRFQIAQHRRKRPLVAPPQIFQLCESCASRSPAGDSQDANRHRVLVFIERNFKACRIVVQKRSAAGTREAFRKALFDSFRRTPGGIASADFAKRREEELYVVWDRPAQQIEKPSDGCIVKREFVAESERIQGFGGGRPAPRIQTEWHEVIDRSREPGAPKNAFEPDGSTDERADPLSQFRRLTQLPKPGHQQLRIADLPSCPQHSRNENRKLVDDDQQIAANIRQPREPRLKLIRGVAPIALLSSTGNTPVSTVADKRPRTSWTAFENGIASNRLRYSGRAAKAERIAATQSAALSPLWTSM